MAVDHFELYPLYRDDKCEKFVRCRKNNALYVGNVWKSDRPCRHDGVLFLYLCCGAAFYGTDDEALESQMVRHALPQCLRRHHRIDVIYGEYPPALRVVHGQRLFSGVPVGMSDQGVQPVSADASVADGESGGICGTRCSGSGCLRHRGGIWRQLARAVLYGGSPFVCDRLAVFFFR